ncbi:MAG: hypothetical protein IBX71_02450 [Candidatus Desulforudis sp.]|nr:hypothetical protein [Desulforudis sp.]
MIKRALLLAAKFLFIRLVWNRAVGGIRRRATRVFNVDNMLGDAVATWWRMRRLK